MKSNDVIPAYRYKQQAQEWAQKVLDDSQQQPAPDTSNEGLVYSAVVQW